MKTGLNDRTTFDDNNMNGWVAEGAETTIEKRGTQFYLQKPQSVPGSLILWKSLPLENARSYSLRMIGEGESRIRFVITTATDVLSESEIKFDGFHSVLSNPFTAKGIVNPTTRLSLIFDNLSAPGQDNVLKLAELHLIEIPENK